MRYKIKKIKSKEKRLQKAAFVACVLLFFLCFSISGFYEDSELPELLYQQKQKIQMPTAFGSLSINQ